MAKTSSIILVFLLSFSCVSIFAQSNAQYAVRFLTAGVDCDSSFLYVDVEVKPYATPTFKLSSLDLRFHYNRNGVLPLPQNPVQGNDSTLAVYVEEEFLSDMQIDSLEGISFYNPHLLTGSMDTVVSYNVFFVGGSGYYLPFSGWTKVGKLRFRAVDSTACIDLNWHDSTVFPNTVIHEVFDGIEYDVAEGSYGDLSICMSDFCNPETLPVELSSFIVTDNGCSSLIEWHTETETDNAYYIVERSADGITYEQLTTLAGAGNSLTPNNYRYVDNDPNLYNYYRLIQVDLDGTHNKLAAKYIQSSCFEDDISYAITDLYPNPSSTRQVKVKLYTATEGEAVYQVLDIFGRQIKESPVSLIEGANVLKIDIEALASGTYFIKVIGNDWETKAKKLIKI